MAGSKVAASYMSASNSTSRSAAPGILLSSAVFFSSPVSNMVVSVTLSARTGSGPTTVATRLEIVSPHADSSTSDPPFPPAPPPKWLLFGTHHDVKEAMLHPPSRLLGDLVSEAPWTRWRGHARDIVNELPRVGVRTKSRPRGAGARWWSRCDPRTTDGCMGLRIRGNFGMGYFSVSIARIKSDRYS
uniref:Uncharacterized protein n=1 Tax=Oryza nivara TaxID=4536 RepID=A0A0E0I3D2_ORYNI